MTQCHTLHRGFATFIVVTSITFDITRQKTQNARKHGRQYTTLLVGSFSNFEDILKTKILIDRSDAYIRRLVWTVNKKRSWQQFTDGGKEALAIAVLLLIFSCCWKDTVISTTRTRMSWMAVKIQIGGSHFPPYKWISIGYVYGLCTNVQTLFKSQAFGFKESAEKLDQCYS